MKAKKGLALLLGISLVLGAVPCVYAGEAAEEASEKTLRIIATSDLHGKFYPWDYALNQESKSGSMAQLVTAVADYYDPETTLLVDAGDTIQDNAADIFLEEEIHPMIEALNYMHYDVWTTGNHEYNYGMDITKDTIADFAGAALVGNVYDENGEHIAPGYTILDKNGLRVAVISMCTPNIVRWDAVNLADCTVTDPIEETQKILEEIDGQYDVLIGVDHMGIENEYGVAGSGITDYANAFPQFDLIVASHEHMQVEGTEINGVLVVENKNMAQTMNVIDLTVAEGEDGWAVTDRTSKTVNVGDYEPDEAFMAEFADNHETAVANAEEVIGVLEDGPLAPENEIAQIPTAQIQDTALIDLINEVQMYYTDADVSAAALFTMDANLYPGDIHKCDMSLIYKYANTLYKLKMNGAQLKKYMEWSMNYYNTYHDGDLTISFNPDIRAYNYDMFSGVNYEVNIANEPGNRIQNLTWPDGTPVEDDDEFTIAVNNYRCNSQLVVPGEIFEEGDTPELLEIDVRGDIGGVREIIGDYIVNVKGGVITPQCDNNWRIVGNDWDEELHQKAVEMIAAGELEIQSSEDGRTPNVVSIRVEDVQ